MKLKRVKANNFWSFSELELDFEDLGLCLIEGINHDEGGSNGSGKSAIFNSVVFGIFGELPKKIKVDEVVNESSAKNCLVEVELQDGPTNYLIVRGRKPNTLNFFVNGEKVSDIDLSDTQKMIETKLGLSFDVFVNSVYIAQNSNNFLLLSDVQKRGILTDIMNLNVFDKALKIIKDDLKVSDLALNTITVNRKNYEDKLTGFDTSIDNLTKKLSNYEEERKQRKEGVFKEVSDIDLKIKDIVEENAKAESDKAAQGVVIKELELASAEKLQAIGELEKEYRAALSQRDTLSVELGIATRGLNKYDVSDTTCPNCFQEVDKEHLANLKQVATEEVNQLKLNHEAANQRLLNLPDLIKLSTLKEAITTKIKDAKSLLDGYSTKIDRNTLILSNYTERRGALFNSIEKENVTENPFAELLQKARNDRDELFLDCRGNNDSFNTEKAKNDELVLLKEVFGNKGIRSFVFDSIINELNYRTNEYLAKLFERNVRLEFCSQSESSTGDVKQSFSTKLFVDNNEVGMGKFSGGQERRLIFAVNLALADIMSNRSSNSFNLMFLDEVFNGLDYEGKIKCMELLVELSEKKDAIVLIDHGSDFQSLFSKVIKVEIKDKISSIK